MTWRHDHDRHSDADELPASSQERDVFCGSRRWGTFTAAVAYLVLEKHGMKWRLWTTPIAERRVARAAERNAEDAAE